MARGAIATGGRMILFVVAFCLTFAAWAQAPIIYPSKGQIPDQQAAEEGQCHAWVKQQTGIDPAMLAAAPSPTAPAAGALERPRLKACSRSKPSGSSSSTPTTARFRPA